MSDKINFEDSRMPNLLERKMLEGLESQAKKEAELNKKLEDSMKESKEHEENSLIDPLTGAKSRRAYENDLPKLRGSNGVIVIDLDNFKNANDEFGHHKGDIVLRTVTLRIKTALREGEGDLYRIGGDEFVVILPNMNDRDLLTQVTSRIFDNVTTDTILGINESGYKQSLSVGAVIGNFNGLNNESEIVRADKETYKSKKNGKNQFTVAE